MIADCDCEIGSFESTTSPLWLFCGTLGTRKFNGGRGNAKSTAKKKSFSFIGLKNGVDRLQNTLFPSAKCTKMKLKNLMELHFKVGLVGHALKFK